MKKKTSSGPFIKCLKCGDIIQSKHRHDMVFCSCGAVGIDGGSAYTRIVGDYGVWKFANNNNKENYEDN